uniref:SET domain-containing protein n=1 Tax=Plectus sambesii TaxID=2011161 RepID=A0A914V9Z4_9BILA
MDDFIRWLADRGLQVGSRLQPRYTEATGWGIYAVDTVRPGETVLRVPDSLLIRASTVTSRSPYDEAIKKHHGLLTPFDTLVLFFCFEDEATSDYGPYLRMLPRTFSTPAVVCPDLAAEALPKAAQPLLHSQREELVQIYDKLAKVSNEFTDEPLSKERFLWAWHVVNTRCIYVENKHDPALDNSHGDTIVIVPFVDLLNHAPDAQ